MSDEKVNMTALITEMRAKRAAVEPNEIPFDDHEFNYREDYSKPTMEYLAFAANNVIAIADAYEMLKGWHDQAEVSIVHLREQLSQSQAREEQAANVSLTLDDTNNRLIGELAEMKAREERLVEVLRDARNTLMATGCINYGGIDDLLAEHDEMKGKP